jgi:hypothetical protein
VLEFLWAKKEAASAAIFFCLFLLLEIKNPALKRREKRASYACPKRTLIHKVRRSQQKKPVPRKVPSGLNPKTLFIAHGSATSVL